MPYPDGSSLHVDADIAVLKSKVEDLEHNQSILFDRCRMNEKWIAGAAAGISVVMAVVGICVAVDVKERTEINQTFSESSEMYLSQESSENY